MMMIFDYCLQSKHMLANCSTPSLQKLLSGDDVSVVFLQYFNISLQVFSKFSSFTGFITWQHNFSHFLRTNITLYILSHSLYTQFFGAGHSVNKASNPHKICFPFRASVCYYSEDQKQQILFKWPIYDQK